MNPILNPYAPGAGTRPPELAGRDEVREKARIALQRVRLLRPTKSMVLVGLRGVGKTVLLDTIRDEAKASGIHTIRIEAPENRSLPALLAPELRMALLTMSRIERAKDLSQRALRALAGFAGALKVKFDDIEVGLDFLPEPGLADNSDLEMDLIALLEAAGEAAKAADTALVLFIDELQYVKENELAALVSALHRTGQQSLPVTMVGAGLPQLRGLMGNAKSYSERLFDFPVIGPLTEQEAAKAIVNPAKAEGVKISPGAVKAIFKHTRGYPYFLQEWGKHVWNVAVESPICARDVKEATVLASAALDESFFKVRFDRMTPAEKRYLRAMSELGEGPHRSGDVARVLGREVNMLAPVRSQLINKGMVWSPSHGDTAFTVPLFNEFMKRTMPGDDWNEPRRPSKNRSEGSSMEP